MTSLSRLKRRAFLTSLTALSVGLAVSCTPSSPDVSGDPSAGASPTTGTSSSGGSGGAVTLSGAGASFPAPVYQRWFADYNKANPDTQISYQSVGSGAGIEQFLAGTVDFGASDAPLKDEEKAQFEQKYGAAPIQVPMTSGAIVFAYNLDGVDELKLSRDAYCGIVSGQITNWNDPAIASANEGAQLPDEPIQWVHRSDGSGTTFQFTTHIEAACAGTWTAGSGKTVEWPAGTGAKGNEGVTAQIQQTPGAIGYVEYAYAKENGLSAASIENKSGDIITPSPESAAQAFVGVEVPADFALLVPDSDNPEAYPITGMTWMLFYPTYQDAAKAEAIKAVVTYGLEDGKAAAEELGYVPIDTELAGDVEEAVAQIK